MICTKQAELGASGVIDGCAAVGRLDIAGWYCSGVLVHPRLVVTVAHAGPRGRWPTPGAVALRVSDLRDSAGAEIIEGRCVAHQEFVGIGHPYDIAIIQLDRASAVSPAALADTSEVGDATEVNLAGYGCEREDWRLGLRFRRSLTVPIQFFRTAAHDATPEAFSAVRFHPGLEFLAGSEEVGPCFGDSGGPAYIKVGQDYKLAGIISRPAARKKPFCGGLTILTRLDVFRTWIEAQVP